MSNQGQSPILTENELKKVIKSLEGTMWGQRNKAILLLAFKAGLRAKEIASVCLGDFVNQAKPISANPMTRSAKTTQSDFYVDADLKRTVTLRKEVTKGGKVEKAHIVNQELRKALLDYLNSRTQPHHIERGLFQTNKYERFDANGIAHLFLALSKKAGIPFTSHGGRRYLCTTLANKGINAFEVQHIMRHKDISTTMRYYQENETRLGSIMEENL
tara:strand:- start:216 stop:863 length:648 start_codon:yes stop_codon:yes gene_type:complete